MRGSVQEKGEGLGDLLRDLGKDTLGEAILCSTIPARTLRALVEGREGIEATTLEGIQGHLVKFGLAVLDGGQHVCRSVGRGVNTIDPNLGDELLVGLDLGDRLGLGLGDDRVDIDGGGASVRAGFFMGGASLAAP